MWTYPWLVPNCSMISSSFLSSVILQKLNIKDSYYDLLVLNVYSTYIDQISFWEGLVSIGTLTDPNTILGNELNFTTSLREVWGPNPRPNPQSDFFLDLLANQHLIDIEPIKLLLTWRNG